MDNNKLVSLAKIKKDFAEATRLFDAFRDSFVFAKLAEIIKELDKFESEYQSLQSECERLKAENEKMKAKLDEISKFMGFCEQVKREEENKKLRELVDRAYELIDTHLPEYINEQWLSDYSTLSTAKEQQNKSVSNEGE